MGFATVCDDRLDVTHASYERVMLCTDNMATVSKTSYARRVHGAKAPMEFVSPAMLRMGNAYVAAMARAFPGDLLTRGYAALRWVLEGCPRGGESLPNPLRFAAYGGVYASLAFVLLALRRPRTALLAMCFLVAFCGSLSLQFEYRHGFYLSFVPALLAGALLHQAGRFLLAILFSRRDRTQQLPVKTARPALTKMRNVVIAVLVGTGLVLAPLHMARRYQRRQVMQMVATCDNARLTAMQSHPVPLDNGVLFRLDECEHPQNCGPFGDLCAAYFMAKFEGSVNGFGLAYDSERGDWDTFRHDIDLAGGDGEELRCFFPVYNLAAGNVIGGWSRFSGIVLRDDQAGTFKGLYRVENTEDFPLFVTITVPANPTGIETCQRLRWGEARRGADESPPELAGMPVAAIREARALGEAGKARESLDLYRAVLKTDPRNLQALMDHAKTLQALDGAAAARTAYRHVLEICPNFKAAAKALARMDGMAL